MGHALITSDRNLLDEGNRVRAKGELDRAIDSADEAGLARWAREWGVAALSATEVAIDRCDDDGDDWW